MVEILALHVYDRELVMVSNEMVGGRIIQRRFRPVDLPPRL